MSERICCEEGCSKLGQHLGRYYEDGTPKRRARCNIHHKEHQARKQGMTRREWENSFHVYRRHRKTYCENRDGRLGFTCTSTIVWEGQLQVDHVNGVHSDNRPENLQTLCANCHAYKTFVEQDWLDKTAA